MTDKSRRPAAFKLDDPDVVVSEPGQRHIRAGVQIVPEAEPAALPAVMEPPSRTGFNAARASSVVSGRFPSSRQIVTGLVDDRPVALSITLITVSTGTISASKRPAACAAATRCCDAKA